MNEELLPVIQAADWGGAAQSVSRPFFPGDAQSPLLVSYAVVAPEANRYLTPESLAQSGRSVEEIEAEAVQRWISMNMKPAWEAMPLPDQDQEAMFIRGESDVISSILLSPGHLKGIHQHFGTKILGVIVPDRFTVLVHPGVVTLPGLAISLYQDACLNGSQLSPLMLSSQNGEIVGYASPQEGEVAASEEPEGEFQAALAAGTVIGGAFLMIAAADGKIDIKEVRSFGQQLQSLAQGGSSLAHQGCRYLVDQELAPIAAFMEDGLDAGQLLGTLKECIESIEQNCGAAESSHLKAMTKKIVTKVAEASGGGFLGLGAKISKDEKQALAMLDLLLGS